MRVGYLFTDIEGSTERWERAPASMRVAKARHDTILDAVIAAHSGAIHDRAGDGVFALFPGGHALRCALALQIALQKEAWTLEGGLWVRIGVHLAEHEAVAADGAAVVGGSGSIDQAAVNRAARIAACGWGGQIVLSAAAAAGFRRPPRAVLTPLGLYRLRGIDEPQALLSLTSPDMVRSSFPPLRALSAQAPMAPPPATPLFGRTRELRDIEALMVASRFVTIIGPGGNGKTRLAMTLAREANMHRAVHVVSFDATETATEQVATIATALRFPFHGGQTREDQLVDYLRNKAALIVLDNADAATNDPSFMNRLTAECAKISVLATSRGPLGATGEQIYRLPGLAIPRRGDEDLHATPAFALFLHEAATAGTGYRVEDGDLPTLREICRVVSGSPLALQLTARWTRLLSPADILARLTTGLGFLDGAEAGEATKRDSLRGVFEGSWALLGDKDRGALGRLSIFSGPFDADSALDVSSVDVHALRRLERRGVVDEAGQRRFQLHPIVREYAREKLSGGPEEERAALDRHCTHFLGLVATGISRLGGAEQGGVLDQLEGHIANVRAAWRHVRGLGDRARIDPVIEPLFYFLALRSLFREGLEMFAGAADEEGLQDYCASLRANCLVHLGDPDSAVAIAQDVLARSSRNPLVRAHALHVLGAVDYLQGAHGLGQSHYEAAYDIRTRVGDLMGASYSAISLAVLCLRRGDGPAARVHVRESYRINRRIGNQVGMMLSSMLAGDVASREGRLADARANYAACLKLEESVHNPQYRAAGLLRWGLADVGVGDRDAADGHFGEAAELAVDIGDRRLKTDALVARGANLRVLGKAEESKIHLLAAIRQAIGLRAQPVLARALVELGHVELLLGHDARACRIARILVGANLQGLEEDYAALVAGLESGLGQASTSDGDIMTDVDAVLVDTEMEALGL